ncbi:DUF4384 domain-containing protein [Candidatus Bipolaricaulota bacterium]|nr:DUF4384 domain-containing protein [Candidatus Bipolaricaulota bacterium]
MNPCKGFVLLAIIVLLVAASVLSHAENLPAGVLPSPTEGELSISVDSDTYAPGDRIRITIDTKKPGFLYLYDIDPSGEITLLYPNIYQPNSEVPAGKMLLPGKGYHLTIGEPEGTETIVAILSRTAIDQLAPSAKEPFRSLDVKPQALTSQLPIALSSSEWSSAWTQFTVYQPKGIVHIGSQPAGARIIVNGHVRGVAPKDLLLPAGEVEITLTKAGYAPFSESIVVHDQDMIDIDARLQEAFANPGRYTGSVPLFIGVDVGKDSVGMEVRITRAFGIAAALRFTGDTAPAPGTTYNYGPELDLDLRLHLALTERMSLLLGGGIGLQNTALAPTVTDGMSALAITIEPDVETEPFPSFVLGLEVDLEHASIFAGYHLRREFIFGVGIQF